MNVEKMGKLVEVLDPDVTLRGYLRLLSGDLAHIGDAIVKGKTIELNGVVFEVRYLDFGVQANAYTVKVETEELNGFKYPAPETVGPGGGRTFYVPVVHASSLAHTGVWCGSASDERTLQRGLVHFTREAAVEHARAIIRAGGFGV